MPNDGHEPNDKPTREQLLADARAMLEELDSGYKVIPSYVRENPDGTITIVPPACPDDMPDRVSNLLALLGGADMCFMENYEKIKDLPISEMSLSQLRTTLTQIFNNDRWQEGILAMSLQGGEISAILRRTLELLDE